MTQQELIKAIYSEVSGLSSRVNTLEELLNIEISKRKELEETKIDDLWANWTV